MRLLFASLLGLAASTVAQLSGSVGPLTSVSSKSQIKTCNVLNYGAKADKSTDLGAALVFAFAACKNGGVILIPAGDYALNTFVTLSGGNAFALQIDGIIYRTGTAGGNMIFIEHSTDVEIFSSTSKGAVQGLGYVFHAQGSLTGPRIFRFYQVNHFSVHDLALTDSPSFHMSLDTCSNGELYNLAIRGGDHGGLDGIDVWSNNVWIHDVEVTNKDECVTVKSPAHNILIENIYCNWSGGCAIGSLGADTDISDILYRNVYTWNSNQMMMIKSNGGSGSVSNVMFENFIGHGNAYSLNLDGYWSSQSVAAGNGVSYSDITFSNWKGTEADGSRRGPIRVICPDKVPCSNIAIEDFAMWTESGSLQYYSCESAYGTGFCLRSGNSAASYAVSSTKVQAAPAGYSAPTMAADIKTGFGYTNSIPIPAIPTSFFPGQQPISKLAGAGGGSNPGNPGSPPSSTPITTAKPPGTTSTAQHYGQCGGQGWTGPTTCEAPYKCTVSNQYYSQCL